MSTKDYNIEHKSSFGVALPSSTRLIEDFIQDKFSVGGYPTIYEEDFTLWIKKIQEYILYECEVMMAHPSASFVKEFATKQLIRLNKEIKEL